MLSTAMRLKVEFICSRIASGATVELIDITWIQKLAARNPSVAACLRKARRAVLAPEAPADGLDAFMAAMDLGDPDPANHLSGPQDPVTLAEWFSTRRAWFRGQAD